MKHILNEEFRRGLNFLLVNGYTWTGRDCSLYAPIARLKNITNYFQERIGPFGISQVTDHSLTLHEIGILNTISIDQAAHLTRAINNQFRFKASKTSLEDEMTVRETESYMETGITSQLLKDPNK